MNVTFKQLNLFVALADTGSVTAAAKAMHISQPTASMQLKDMTRAVGVPLYEVVSKKVYFTDAGKALAGTARDILQSWAVFEHGVNQAQGLTRGKLKVAVVSTAKYFMPRLMGGFCKLYPDIDVSLEILNRDGVVNRMRDNLDDVYIMSQPPSDIHLVDEVFIANPLVVIAAAGDPLAQQQGVSLDMLMQRRWILREKGSGTRMGVEQFFKAKDVVPNVRMELGSNEAIKEAVAAGFGLGLVSVHALQGLQTSQGVCVLQVEGLPIMTHWHIVHPVSKKLSPLAQAFRHYLRTKLPESGV